MRLSGLAGGVAGSTLVALGFVASVVMAPPALEPMPQAMEQIAARAPEPEPDSTPATETPLPANVAQPKAQPPATDPAPDMALAAKPGDAQTLPEALTTPDTPTVSAPAKPDLAKPDPAKPVATGPAPVVPKTDGPMPSDSAAMVGEDSPRLPEATGSPRISTLPGQPVPPRDQPLPQPPTAPEQATPPAQDTLAEDSAPEEPRLPGTRVQGLPGQSDIAAPDAEAPGADSVPTALERNSSFSGTLTGAPLMAIILNDPGLPTPLRRSLAALELPVTIALNPMDPSAPQAADIYRKAGKDVLILAGGIPAGARATDLDVTFSAYFEALPQAVAVLDLPRDGFSRNSTLTGNILPLVSRDGHGLVSFAGGLSRVAAAAQNAGVPHAEVFRVLDDEDQSPFTIRRYLDRAVFQASQIGEVIVFGDATNDATMEALELWRSEGRVDQVALVPVSAILLTR